jgi:hypothetical protein
MLQSQCFGRSGCVCFGRSGQHALRRPGRFGLDAGAAGMTTAAGRAGMTVFAAVWNCVSVGESGGSVMPVMEPYAEGGGKGP